MLGNMSFEEEREFWREVNKKKKEEEKKIEMKCYPEHFDKNGNRIIIRTEEYKPTWDKPGTLEDDEALILYIIVMAVGTIFYDRWLIWIAATWIYLKFRNRHNK